MQERQWITARRSELDALADQLTKQLQEVQVERDELAVAEQVLNRLAEQAQADAEAAAPVAPVSAKVAGRAVLLIPHRGDVGDEGALPGDYRKILAIVREADGPVQVRAVGERLGLDASVRGKLEPLRAKMTKLADRGRLHKRPDGRSPHVRDRVGGGVTGGPPAAVEFGVKKNNGLVEGPDGLVCTARLPLSSATLNYLADLIRGHLKKIGSRWRALPAGKIAGIVPAVLRCDRRPGDLAGGNGVHRTTVSRWVREVVGLPAARAPRLDRALKKIARKGGGVVLLDGSLIRTRRRTGADNRRNYSGKHKCHGLLVIALTDDRGRLVWISAVRPGRTSEITACRHDKLTAKLRTAGLGAIADLGFVGLDDGAPDADPAVITGYKAARNRPLTRGQKLSNKALAAVRAPVEHGFAHLKNWRVLGKVRTDPRWATALVRALLVLTNREVAR